MWERMGGAMHQEYDYYRPHGDAPSQGFVQPFVDRSDSNPVSSAEDAFLQLIGGVKHMVYITSPYLAIDESMEKACAWPPAAGGRAADDARHPGTTNSPSWWRRAISGSC